MYICYYYDIITIIIFIAIKKLCLLIASPNHKKNKVSCFLLDSEMLANELLDLSHKFLKIYVYEL